MTRCCPIGEFGPSCLPVIERLEKLVQAAIRAGWTPLGGVTLGPPDSDGDSPFINLLQVIVKV